MDQPCLQEIYVCVIDLPQQIRYVQQIQNTQTFPDFNQSTFNNTPESGLEPWFLFSVSYMLYLLSNPTTSMRVSHQCSVSLSQINIISEHNPDTYYVSSVNLFAVAINVISIDRVNGDKDVSECNSFKNAIPCFHVLLKKYWIEFVFLCWFWTFIYRLTVHYSSKHVWCETTKRYNLFYSTVSKSMVLSIIHGVVLSSSKCFFVLSLLLEWNKPFANVLLSCSLLFLLYSHRVLLTGSSIFHHSPAQNLIINILHKD